MSKGDFSERLAAWMRGRNGSDELGTFAIVLSLVLVVINLFARTFVLSILALVLLAYAWWRMSSKNLQARDRENRAFASLLGPVRPWLRNPAAALAEAKAYKHLKCPECGRRMRVPRGKGKLRVKCPQCHEKFITRT